jgi:sugar phosphate isomerase/epimerase
MDRRSFLKAGLLGAAGSACGRPADAAGPEGRAGPPKSSPRDRLCLFTDHLDDFGYSYGDVASMLSQLRVAGPDLTVRPGGLVDPKRVGDELPKAAAAFRDQGLSVPMLSTGLTSAGDPAAAATFAAMQQLGIRYYKLGYYAYEDLTGWRARLEAVRMQVSDLVRLGRQHGVRAGFHNHSGPVVGGALWDSWEILRQLDPKWIGVYFDPAQATIEGGKHAWKLNFQRASARLLMVAIKDFVWEKAGGEWQARWCPLGEGMVNWREFFRELERVDFDGPISLHIEYDPGGKTRLERFENSLAAAERDLRFLRDRLDEVAA